MQSHIQSALIVILNNQPKILCAWFQEDKNQNWNSRGQQVERQCEVHISVSCRAPPPRQEFVAVETQAAMKSMESGRQGGITEFHSTGQGVTGSLSVQGSSAWGNYEGLLPFLFISSVRQGTNTIALRLKVPT